MKSNQVYIVFLSLLFQKVVSFTISHLCVQEAIGERFASRVVTRVFAIVDKDNDDDIGKKSNPSERDIPLEELSVDYTGSVDWDAEWKKVVKSKDRIKDDRPGKDFYKSEAEIAAIRAANKATEQAARLAANVPTIPSWEVLKGDWRFWIAILAVISIGSSVLAGAATQSNTLPTNAASGSYYI